VGPGQEAAVYPPAFATVSPRLIPLQ
jgi:hypothetical protein